MLLPGPGTIEEPGLRAPAETAPLDAPNRSLAEFKRTAFERNWDLMAAKSNVDAAVHGANPLKFRVTIENRRGASHQEILLLAAVFGAGSYHEKAQTEPPGPRVDGDRLALSDINNAAGPFLTRPVARAASNIGHFNAGLIC